MFIKNHKCRYKKKGKNNSGITEKRCSLNNVLQRFDKRTKEQQAPKISPTASTNNEENFLRSCGKPCRLTQRQRKMFTQIQQNGTENTNTTISRAIFELLPKHSHASSESSPKMKYFAHRKYIRLLSSSLQMHFCLSMQFHSNVYGEILRNFLEHCKNLHENLILR